MNFIRLILVMLFAFSLLSCAAPMQKHGVGDRHTPLDLLPMYGYPREKTEAQKNADRQFIKQVVANSGSRQKACREFAAEGWRLLGKGGNENAMRRFNQAWLLNPNNYSPYWGFAAILVGQDRPDVAVVHYDKALSLNNDRQRPRLLVDAAKAYLSVATKSSNSAASSNAFHKTNSLLSEAVKLDPQYARSYQVWASAHFIQGDYKRAWDMVKQLRRLNQQLSPRFIEALQSKMPEPN